MGRRRAILGAVLLAPIGFIGISTIGGDIDPWMGPAMALALLAMMYFFHALLRGVEKQTANLCGDTLKYSGGVLRQLGENGEIRGVVDIRRPYDVRYPYHAAGNAIYTVTGITGKSREESCVTFSSRIENGERLVRGILGQSEWPPGANG